jgi:hypothetical protein
MLKFRETYGQRHTFEGSVTFTLVPGMLYDITPHKEKRSLQANAYCWKLCSLIAEEVKSSKDEIYEEMIQKYGVLTDIAVTVKSEVDMRRIEGHWKYISESSDGKWKAYLMILGSSDYTTKEMANFIDMIIDEAKALGIETLPPEEIDRMMQRYYEQNEQAMQEKRKKMRGENE